MSQKAKRGGVGINIAGAKVDKASVDAVASAVERIFAAAATANMDQETVCRALEVLREVGRVGPTNITNSTFSGIG